MAAVSLGTVRLLGLFRCLPAGTAGVGGGPGLLGCSRLCNSRCLHEVTTSGFRLDRQRRNLDCGCCLYRPIFSRIRRGGYGVLHRLFLRLLICSLVTVGHVKTSLIPESLLDECSALVIGCSADNLDVTNFVLRHSGLDGRYNNTSVTDIRNRNRYTGVTAEATTASGWPSLYLGYALCRFFQGQHGTLIGLACTLAANERTIERRITEFYIS